MDAGNLVPDEVVIGMVEDKIKEYLDSKGFIFDGFPRTVNQAEALDTMLRNNSLSISGMIELDVPTDELKIRLKERGKISGRTDDQNEEKINNRLRVYSEETLPVAGYYKTAEKYSRINGVGSIDGIFDQIDDVIMAY